MILIPSSVPSYSGSRPTRALRGRYSMELGSSIVPLTGAARLPSRRIVLHRRRLSFGALRDRPHYCSRLQNSEHSQSRGTGGRDAFPPLSRKSSRPSRSFRLPPYALGGDRILRLPSNTLLPIVERRWCSLGILWLQCMPSRLFPESRFFLQPGRSASEGCRTLQGPLRRASAEGEADLSRRW